MYNSWLPGFICGIGFGQFIGLIVWGLRCDRRWRRDTVKRGVALYDPITGK